MRHPPHVLPCRAVGGIIPHLDIHLVNTRPGWQGVIAIFGKTQVDVELTVLIIAFGQAGQKILVHVIGVRTATGQGVKIPHGMGLGQAIHFEGDAMRRQVIDLAEKQVACANIEAVIRTIRNGVAAKKRVAAGEEPDRLDLRRLRVHIGIVKELKRVQVHIASS